MNYGAIKETDIANGIGIRVSLFVSGCTHRCKNCFNPETWDFNFGTPFDERTEELVINLLSPSYINGLSVLGGEPLEPRNQQALYPFLKKVKDTYPKKDIWLYSGYTFETDILSGRAHCDVTDEILGLVDVLVDGEFVEELKNIRLKFRGSENQRIINVPRSLETGETVIVNL